MKYGWLVNAGCIIGIVVCLVLVPKEESVSGTVTVTPVVLASTMWSDSVKAKSDACLGDILVFARNTKGLTDEYLPDAKRLYWLCMSQLGGVI